MSETKLHTAQLGSNELVWTEGNLQAGSNITISKQPDSSIDADTLILCHFDNNADNAGTYQAGTAIASGINAYSTSYSAFEDGYGARIKTQIYETNWLSLNEPTYLTVDFWMAINLDQYDSSSQYTDIYWNTSPNGSGSASFCFFVRLTDKHLVTRLNNINTDTGIVIESNRFYHIAYEIAAPSDTTKRVTNFFVDGELVFTANQAYAYISSIRIINKPKYWGGYVASGWYIDELRMSSTLRYHGENFKVPTSPYSSAPATDAYNINAHIPVDSELLPSSKHAVQNKAVTAALNNKLDTATAASTYATKEEVTGKQDADTAYNKTNLLAGENITFTTTDLPEYTTSYTVVGEPTISTSGVLTGCSDTKFLYAEDKIARAESINSFVIHAKVNPTNSSMSNGGIIDTGNNSVADGNSKLTCYRLTQSAMTFRFRISSDGSQTYPVDVVSPEIPALNQDYYVKATFDGTTYTCGWSLDDVDWSNTTSVTSSTLPRHNDATAIIIIGDNIATNFSYEGSIYLPEVWVELNGTKVWSAWEYKKAVAISSVIATETVSSSNPSLVLESNKVYTCTSVDSLTITSVPVSNHETIVYFNTSASFTGVTLPANQPVIGTLPTWEASKSYVMSIQNGILVAAEVKTL